MAHKILLVDDEVDILEFLSYNLIKAGYEVATAHTGLDAVAMADHFQPHLILLDLMMPRMNGIEACREIRARVDSQHTIIAFLTARGEDYSQIEGFEAGADDYIKKPIRPDVLLSRIKALLKRFPTPSDLTHTTQGLTIDPERYLITVHGKDLSLPKKEFEILSLLHSKPEKVFSRDEIFSRVWGNDVIVGDRTIDVHIRKLREKIGHKFIVTIKGVGYKLSK